MNNGTKLKIKELVDLLEKEGTLSFKMNVVVTPGKKTKVEVDMQKNG